MKLKYAKTSSLAALACVLFSYAAVALPSGFTGTYQILQSRVLGLTNGRGYVLQDGNLVADSAIDSSRTYCRAGQSTFDESSGQIEVVFQNAIDGSEHALLKTIPSAAAARPTTLECIATNGFAGTLDLSIALGRVFELTR